MSTPPASVSAKGTVTVVEPSRGQLALARRVAEARAIVPDLTVAAEVDAEAASATGIAFDVLLVRAAALALRAHPHVNGAYKDASFEHYERVNVAVLVPGPDGGQATPTVLDADRKDAATVAAELGELGARIADGTVTSPALRGATFTVSSLPIRRSTPVVVSGQAAHLAAGAVAPRAVVRNGAVVARLTVDLVLAVDARIVDGPTAAAFLTQVQGLLEAPDVLV